MSTVADLTPLGIREEDLNLLRNDHIKFDCGPLVYRIIIDWGFGLPEGKKIIDHINDQKLVDKIKEKCNVDLKKWMKKNESKLDTHIFSDFDITALHDFLPILCYGEISQTGGQEYNERTKDPNTVESLLKKIKSFRNDVSHEVAVAKDNAHIDETKQTMRKCIRAAGELYGKDQCEIDEKVKLLDDEFEKILCNTTHLYENRVKYIAQKISSEVPANLLERYTPYFTVPLPGNSPKKDTLDIFQCSNLSVITEDKEGKEDKHSRTIFPCTEIYNNKHEKFIVINGGPGSGKTTLMKNLCQDILETSVHGSTPRYEKIEQFKIPIYLECRSEQQTNLSKFLRECLNDFLSPEDDIYEAFKIVKGLVFLIDGYDEINNNCQQLVDSIVNFCRDNNASCIISSRVDAGNHFVSELQRKYLNYTKMFIEPISNMSEKVIFLRSYADKMDGSIDTDKLVNSFENLTAAAKEVFTSPILLALFISLFVHDPDSVSQMKNEQGAYEAVRTNFLREMTIKLRKAPNPKGKAEKVAYVLGKFCLRLFKAKKYFLEGKDYTKMVTECEKIKGMPDDIDIPNLLSCILTPEHSFKYALNTSYQFMHSTIQEFFAAKFVSENIEELQDDRISQSKSEDKQLPELLQILGLDGSQSDIKEEMERYGNIIKLLMLETLANEELSKYSNTFTLLLKKYYKPQSHSPVYQLDLILSSDSNAEIIIIVSDSMIGWREYNIKYYRHIKPMIDVIKKFKSGVKIDFYSNEIANTQQIIQLLTVLGDDSEIQLTFRHSHDKYQALEGEFYTQLKNCKCKITGFIACISSSEHLSIVVSIFRGHILFISTPSVTDICFAALEEYKGWLWLTVKYTDDFPSTGSNPVRESTALTVEHIPADGKEKTSNLLKYILPKSKEFSSIELPFCNLTDTDAYELLKKLEKEKMRTEEGKRTEMKEERVHPDQSRYLKLHLKESEEEIRERERRDEEKREKERREEERKEEERREEERREAVKREEERREKEEREEEERYKKMRNVFLFILFFSIVSFFYLDLLRSFLFLS